MEEFNCPECGYWFSGPITYREHLEERHTEALCDRFDNASHRWTYWTLYFLKCADCGATAPRKEFANTQDA